ncbi:MAG TPA: hypothetical protein VGW12_03455 [Pyrinomonadaceae bacterium]|nr:hypothetical protein [Pyrinomonadaceae bacterium]
MRLVNQTRLRRGWKSILLATSFLFLFSVCASSAFAQDATTPAATPDSHSANQEVTVTDILKLKGRVLGEGSNAKAVGQHKVASYRVEEVTLPRVQEVEIKGETRTVGRAFRLTIKGGPFPVRAMPAVVWLDDTAVGYGIENEDLNEITVITYDESLLKEGASIYLSYGDKNNKEDRSALPEKLKLGGAKGDNQ